MAGLEATMAELSEITGWSRERIKNLAAAGMPAVNRPQGRKGEWRFNTASVFEWALRRSGPEMQLKSEQLRLVREQADRIGRENAVARGEVLPAGEVRDALDRMIAAANSRLEALPLKMALLLRPDDVLGVKVKLEGAIEEARAELRGLKAEGSPGPAH